MKDYIEAGLIINTHGVSGEVKMEVWLDSPAFMKTFKRVFLGTAMREYKVLSARTQKDFILLRLDGIDDMNAAMTFKNTPVYISRSDARLPEGGYFLCEIIGAEVRDEQGSRVGVLREIMENPAHPIYIVESDNGVEHLIPAVPQFVISAEPDTPDGPVVIVRLIDGM